ncbi:MAG: thioredoxin-like domain-containing protein [Gemmataceae bacterium]
MSNLRLSVGLVALGLLTTVPTAYAQPSVEQLLQYRPSQTGVNISTPTKAEYASCKVKILRGSGSSGYLLQDPSGRPLRRMVDNDQDKKIDTWSYFLGGLETYREIDSNGNNRPDQFRWLNQGGMKWGIDRNEDGQIDHWKLISADELAQEAFQAVATRNFARLEALLITSSELKALGLPEPITKKITAKLQMAKAGFQATIKKVPDLRGRNVIGRVESSAPQCVPGESLGAQQDLFRYPSRTVLFQSGKDQHDWLQTGEMVQIGMSWRLLGVPGTRPKEGGTSGNSEAQKVMDELAKLDGAYHKSPVETQGVNKRARDYNLKRASLIEKLLPLLSADEREEWFRQLLDNYVAAARRSADNDTLAITRLRQLKVQVERQSPNSKLAGYATFRLIWAEYGSKLVGAPPSQMAKIQDQWIEKLAEFVQAYPQADDTPDALQQLAMAAEFAGKTKTAQRYYQQLATGFPQNDLATKAAGAVRRLGLNGNRLQLVAPTINGQRFDAAGLRGKCFVVYYWASYDANTRFAFEKLNKLRKAYGRKGFEIVTVNLDDTPQVALKFLQKNPVTGYHLYQAGKQGGMSSPLAEQYGIMAVPHMFFVGKNGAVVDNAIQINDLEDSIRKELK